MTDGLDQINQLEQFCVRNIAARPHRVEGSDATRSVHADGSERRWPARHGTRPVFAPVLPRSTKSNSRRTADDVDALHEKVVAQRALAVQLTAHSIALAESFFVSLECTVNPQCSVQAVHDSRHHPQPCVSASGSSHCRPKRMRSAFALAHVKEILSGSPGAGFGRARFIGALSVRLVRTHNRHPNCCVVIAGRDSTRGSHRS